MNKVKVWKETVVIPTYKTGQPEKNPMFMERRVYQGSSGVVYPYPVVEQIEDTPCDKSYEALFLENEYLKIMILPELGGRVQMAYDKIKQRHFIYYNQVIKPALVGLTGPWISGGIEFNWPQHHRPSTFTPIDYTIEEFPDGSATVWVSERERMFHQRGAAGFTLRPARAVLEINGKVYNPTPLPQTFLWWANPAVAVNDDYQSVFPSDVNAVFDHGKRDVSTFPIATGTYYKMDYSAGVDISRYKNIPVPTSYMAIQSKYNFVGGYENDSHAGLLHVANHNVAPGKKQWTWGCGDFGVAWDRNLTDQDGPYIELMTGVYTDNQPDFAWLQPYEEKTFTQYFMPYRELGVVKNASADLLLNLEIQDGKALIKIFATSIQRNINVVLRCGNTIYYRQSHTITPEEVFIKEVDVKGEQLERLELSLLSENGWEVLGWKAESADGEIPEAAHVPGDPIDVATAEELFLIGQHLEQYRHATYDPTTYYGEALRRDPLDVRNNNAMGLWLLRHGKFADSEKYFRAAIKRQTVRNPNPYDGEPYYNLGLCLKFQGKLEESYEALYKSCWNSAWQDSGYFTLSQISVMKNNFSEALYEVEKSLLRNCHNMSARHLKTAILRHLQCEDDALALIKESLDIDKFNFGCLFEKYLITAQEEDLNYFTGIVRADSHNYQEVAVDYLLAGLYDEAVAVLNVSAKYCTQLSPMVFYYMGYAHMQAGRIEESKEAYTRAMRFSPDYCFPNRLEAILALEAAVRMNPADSRASYYLGNIWYDKRQYSDAIRCWEISVQHDPGFPLSKRNLALGYFNKLERHDEAIRLLESAFTLDTSDTRILMELDQLYKRMKRPHSERLAFLDKYRSQVDLRDDLYLEYATLLNQLGRFDEAKKMIGCRKFHVWEGGEGKVPAQYQLARVELAKKAIIEGQFEEAIAYLKECYHYPENLGEGKLRGAQENDFNYWLGCAYEGLGEKEKAIQCYIFTSEGLSEPSDAIYYNDQKPDKILYQGLALKKMGRIKEAEERLNRLIEYGVKHIDDQVKIDYFAVSLPDLLIWEDNLNLRNRTHCNYMIGLGYLGMDEYKEALKYLLAAFELNKNHQGVQCHIMMLKNKLLINV